MTNAQRAHGNCTGCEAETTTTTTKNNGEQNLEHWSKSYRRLEPDDKRIVGWSKNYEIL